MRVRSGAPARPTPPTSSSGARPRPHPFVTVLGERAGVGPPGARAPATTPPGPAPHKPPVARLRGPPPAPAGPSPSPIRALLERTLGAERGFDTLLAAAARGRTFSPAELLALQTSVFRYSQAVEVVSRATDKLVGAIKQTMGTQV